MKINTKQLKLEQQPRRSPRLNPPPRRSPRIQEREEREEMLSQRTERTSNYDTDSSTDSEREQSPRCQTPKSKPVPKAGSSSSRVQFRNTRVVQQYSGSDPPSRVKRRSVGKRLFRSESQGEGSRNTKRLRSGGEEEHDSHRNGFVKFVTDHPLLSAGLFGISVTIGAVMIGKFVLKW